MSETPAGDESVAPEAAPAAPAAGARAPNPLSRPTDAVARPGFRNPPNAKSKAQKSGKGKR
jgi:hypothetical protein